MSEFIISQMHIEAARNSTDDFNLFHDKNRWHHIQSNPFEGPIALGFQLGCFVEDQMNRSTKNYASHLESKELPSEDSELLNFSQYELSFAGSVKPGDTIELVVRDGRFSEISGVQCFTNRIALKANGKTVLLGYKRYSTQHLVKGVVPLPELSEVINGKDRSFIGTERYFLKRKYMIVGNAKNFLASAFAEQSEYIDEFADKVSFPEMYPLSLVSSALLERAKAEGHNLVEKPMIYVSHKLSIDRILLAGLKSNDALNILVSSPHSTGNQNSENVTQVCTCVLSNQQVIFHAEIQLVPLSALLNR
ncbi:hypothetical protein [uncultured Paraglaciecola sp.]|jgi:hypothetical protein|uniref:hypothetical protein n=1 Tax=uncultured Paraglaciecola sp. TaxID=1765024 RepID=UPI0025EE596A|nr:hypothetical protein [uncultured Paraglaciecola sp.]